MFVSLHVYFSFFFKLGAEYVQSMENKLTDGKKKYKKYQQKTLGMVGQLRPISPDFISYTNSGFHLVWTSPQPRIGISSEQTQSLRFLYNFMVDLKQQMENYLSTKDSSLRNFGCHFCLFVSGSSQGNTTTRSCNILTETGTTTINQNLVGYIQMDDQLYYRLLPTDKHKQTWINAFTNAEFFVTT